VAPDARPTRSPGGMPALSNTTPGLRDATATEPAQPNGSGTDQTVAPDSLSGSTTEAPPKHKQSLAKRLMTTVKDIIFGSWINVLLVFVPVGIAVHFAHLSAGVVFTMNALAIIPLANLLSHSTEIIASRMGDTIGALMNVTFGNAVELIIL
jgi:Ca2+:H+ antiporter